jgi:hypothetical protein
MQHSHSMMVEGISSFQMRGFEGLRLSPFAGVLGKAGKQSGLHQGANGEHGRTLTAIPVPAFQASLKAPSMARQQRLPGTTAAFKGMQAMEAPLLKNPAKAWSFPDSRQEPNILKMATYGHGADMSPLERNQSKCKFKQFISNKTYGTRRHEAPGWP